MWEIPWTFVYEKEKERLKACDVKGGGQQLVADFVVIDMIFGIGYLPINISRNIVKYHSKHKLHKY